MPNLVIHLLADVVLIGVIYFYYTKVRKKSVNMGYISLMIFASNLIDVDHLVADPIYDPTRCSINFHPLHKLYLFPLYVLGLFWRRYSYFFMGIVLHIALDGVSCLI